MVYVFVSTLPLSCIVTLPQVPHDSDSGSTNVSLGTYYGLPVNSGSMSVIANELYLEDDTIYVIYPSASTN